MDRNKLSLIVAGVAALALVVGGWFVGVQPQLAAGAAAAAQRSDIDDRNDTVRTEIARLERQYADFDSLKARLGSLSASIPSSTDTTPFIEELDQLAAANGVSIGSLTFGDAQTYVPPAAPASGVAGSTTATGTPSPTASAAPSEGATAIAAPPVVTSPLITSGNFVVIPVSVTVDGSDTQALAFTSGVQKGARLFLVNSIGTGSTQGETTGADASSGAVGGPSAAPGGASTWTLSGFVFVLQRPASGSTGSVPTSTSTASSTPSATATPAG